LLAINRIKAAAFKMAECYPIKKMSLFGSYADGKANDNSDLDFLVEFFTPNVSLVMLSSIKNALEDELQTKIDIIHGPMPENSMLRVNKVIDIYEQ